MPTVKEIYNNVDIDELKERAAISHFWENSLKFFKDVMNQDISKMTEKQIGFLERISECIERD